MILVYRELDKCAQDFFILLDLFGRWPLSLKCQGISCVITSPLPQPLSCYTEWTQTVPKTIRSENCWTALILLQTFLSWNLLLLNKPWSPSFDDTRDKKTQANNPLLLPKRKFSGGKLKDPACLSLASVVWVPLLLVIVTSYPTFTRSELLKRIEAHQEQNMISQLLSHSLLRVLKSWFHPPCPAGTQMWSHRWISQFCSDYVFKNTEMNRLIKFVIRL